MYAVGSSVGVAVIKVAVGIAGRDWALLILEARRLMRGGLWPIRPSKQLAKARLVGFVGLIRWHDVGVGIFLLEFGRTHLKTQWR